MTSTPEQPARALAAQPRQTAADHQTQVQALARYAARARFGDLSDDSRRLLPVHILDSLACCIAALGAGPVNACRDQVRDFGGGHGSTLIGGGTASPVYAAFWHTVLVRYVDFMDNFLAPTETCHTADNFGVALTAAELAGGSGQDLMLGVAIGYTVQSRLVDHGNFMTRGFDHTAQLAFSHTPKLDGWACLSRRSRTLSRWPRPAMPRSGSSGPSRCRSGRDWRRRSRRSVR
jgi:2-methylcitrate dehydratase